MKVSLSGRRELLIVGIIGIICTLLSVYLIYDHIKDEDASFCDVGSHISCSKVRRSSFSELFNVPIAVFGFLFNVITSLMALVAIQISIKQLPYYIGYLFYWNLFGCAFIFYLICAEIYLGALCPFCTVLHVFQLISMYVMFKLYNSKKAMPALFDVMWEMKTWIICIGIINLVPLVYFNVTPQFGIDDAPTITNPEFARCITHSGWIFYGKVGCGWCGKQKELFGSTLDKIVFVDCGTAQEDCKALNIEAYPTWIRFNEEGDEINRWKGYVSVDTWEILSDCRNAHK